MFTRIKTTRINSGENNSTSRAKNFYSSSSSVSTLTTKLAPFYASSAYSSSSSICSFSSSCSSFSEFHSKFKTYEEDYHNVMPSHLIKGSKQTNEPKGKEQKSENITRKGYRTLNSFEDKDTKMQRESERQKKAEDKEKNLWCRSYRMIWDKLMKKDKEPKKEQKKESYDPMKPILDFPTSDEGPVTCNRDLVEDGYKIFQVVWRCTMCTFLNHSLLPTCEECGMFEGSKDIRVDKGEQ